MYSGIDTQPSYINYSFTLAIPLTAGADYIMVVTTQSLDTSIPDGIVFPTTEGVYTVTIWTVSTGTVTKTSNHHKPTIFFTIFIFICFMINFFFIFP